MGAGTTFDLIPTNFDTLWQRSYTVDAPDLRSLYERFYGSNGDAQETSG